MTYDHRPKASLCFRCTGRTTEQVERDEEITLEIAHTLREAGYNVSWPLAREYQNEPSDEQTGQLYWRERNEVINSELLVAYVTEGSTGMGRELEVGEQELLPVIFVQLEGCELSRMGRGPSRSTTSVVTIASSADVRNALLPIAKRLLPELVKRSLIWPPRQEPPTCGRELRRRREAAGMSQTAFAQALSLSRDFISDVEEGRLVPSPYALRVLASGLGLNSAGPLLGQTLQASTKSKNERVVWAFFENKNLGCHDFIEFCESYENELDEDRQLTDEDICEMFQALFDRPC